MNASRLLFDQRCTHTDVYRMRIDNGGDSGIYFAQGYPGEPIVTITFVDGKLADTNSPPLEAFRDGESWWNAMAAIAAKVKELTAAYQARKSAAHQPSTLNPQPVA